MTKDTTQTTTNPPIEPVKPTKQSVQIVKRGGIGFITALLLSIFGALGGAYLALFASANPRIIHNVGLDRFLPIQSNSMTKVVGDELSALRADIVSLNSKIAPQTSQNVATPTPQPQAQQTANLDPLKSEIAGLSGRLTAIETRLAALDPTGTGGAIIASLQAEIATLKVTTADLQTKIAQTPSPAVTFAVISLAEAANRNGAFVPEFASVRAALPFLPEVTALEPFSRTGAPTRALISERFNQLAIAFSNRDAQAKKESGVLGWFKGLFSGLIKVENKNDANGPNAILARAKTKIDSGDLQGAIDDVRTIPSPPNEVGVWLNDAQRRLDLEVKIASLRGAIERGMTVQPANQNANNQQALPAANTPITLPAAKAGEAK